MRCVPTFNIIFLDIFLFSLLGGWFLSKSVRLAHTVCRRSSFIADNKHLELRSDMGNQNDALNIVNWENSPRFDILEALHCKETA